MPHDLQPSDLLSRFLLHRRYINEEKRVVNSSVFSEKHPQGFSVFQTTGLDDVSIWELATTHVLGTPPKNLYGRCDLAAGGYQESGLTIEIKQPPPRHYEIYGMPVSSDMEEATKLSKRQVMVAKASYIPYSKQE
jgi:hypothetical protein